MHSAPLLPLHVALSPAANRSLLVCWPRGTPLRQAHRASAARSRCSLISLKSGRPGRAPLRSPRCADLDSPAAMSAAVETPAPAWRTPGLLPHAACSPPACATVPSPFGARPHRLLPHVAGRGRRGRTSSTSAKPMPSRELPSLHYSPAQLPSTTVALMLHHRAASPGAQPWPSHVSKPSTRRPSLGIRRRHSFNRQLLCRRLQLLGRVSLPMTGLTAVPGFVCTPDVWVKKKVKFRYVARQVFDERVNQCSSSFV